MIKINLLESVTDRQPGTARVVEKKVSSPLMKLMAMSVAVFALLFALIGWDVISTNNAKAAAEKEREVQKAKAAELETVMKEQKELEQKINNIDIRIEAIKKLRSTQAGPSAVLNELRERIGGVPGLYLDNVEQKGEQLTISGDSPDEDAVTKFGKSLEFSGGLFSNLTIETQTKEIPIVQTSGPINPDAPKPTLVNFKIKCAYTPSKANASQTTAANGQNPAQPGAADQKAANNGQAPNAPPQQPQVAKN